ncbi:HEAT repeat domain-containing protein [Planctellipticum variicoloris]|uniref:HEAT repeat domain-containing protein n=1 Tax=Planctellipticum variicoloris TaxID=3064265 RepID=UPI00301381AE|nr:HEAT repeat domain-containing protein [Planctomycetaceae bacterium SH412]
MWWRNWWEAVRDPFDPVPRRLWKALVLLAVGLFGIYVVWPRVRIEWLVVNLHANPDSQTAREAAWRLGEIGNTARGALPSLIEALDAGPIEQPAADSSSRTHQIGLLSVEAAQAIRKIGDPETVALLHRRMIACRDSDSDAGAGAARLYIALNNAGGVQAGNRSAADIDVAEVFDVLRDSRNALTCNLLLSWLNARSLVSPDMDPDGQLKAILIDCLNRLQIAAAARILVAWAEHDPAVVPVILDEECRQYRAHSQDFTSSGVLYQPIHGRENATIRESLPLLTTELDGPDAPMIVRLFAECFWFDRQQDERYRRQPPRAEVLLEYFRTSLSHEKATVRQGAAQILTRIAETAADDDAHQSAPLFDAEILARLEHLLNDPDPPVRLAASVALWKIRQQAEPGLTELLAGLESPHEASQTLAAAFFRGLGPHDAWAVSALTAHLQSTSTTVRVAILRGLAVLGPSARDSIPAIIATLDSDDEETLTAAVECLAAFGPDASEALPRLWDVFLNSDDVDIRRLANTAMAKIDPNRRNRDR